MNHHSNLGCQAQVTEAMPTNRALQTPQAKRTPVTVSLVNDLLSYNSNYILVMRFNYPDYDKIAYYLCVLS